MSERAEELLVLRLRLGVEAVCHRFPLETSNEVLGGEHGHLPSGGEGGGTEVREDGNARGELRGEEGMGGRKRLRDGDVEGGGSDLVGLEGSDEIILREKAVRRREE